MKRSRVKYFLLGVLVLVAAIGIWQFYMHGIANRTIHRTVIEKSKGLYHVHYDSLAINLALGYLHMKNVELVPDTAVFNQLVNDKKAPPAILRVFIPDLTLLRIRTPKALIKKQIEGGKIEIEGPTIEIELNKFLGDTSGYSPAKDLYKQLLGNLLSIKIDSIAITHAHLIVKNMRASDTLFKGANLSLKMSGFLIDSSSKDDSSRILFSRDVDVACDEILLPSRKKDYRLYLEKLKFISEDNSFSVRQVILAPQMSEEAFARKMRLQKDRYHFLIHGVDLRNIQREGLWKKRIIADSLIISKSSWKIYRDLSYPRDTLSRIGKYPYQDLMRLPIQVLIKKIIVRNAFIEYKEKNAKSQEAGKVQFYRARAVFSNVTNIHTAIIENNKCVLDFNSKFLNKAPFSARLTMFLRNPHGKFSIGGSLGALNAETVNPLMQPMALARIDRGVVDTAWFNFSGDDYSSSGEILLLYKDLKVSLLKKDKNEKKYDRKTLPSLFAEMMVKKNNPSSNNDPRIEIFHYSRNINRSFFNMLWKSVLAGIKQTAGVK